MEYAILKDVIQDGLEEHLKDHLKVPSRLCFWDEKLCFSSHLFLNLCKLRQELADKENADDVENLEDKENLHAVLTQTKVQLNDSDMFFEVCLNMDSFPDFCAPFHCRLGCSIL